MTNRQQGTRFVSIGSSRVESTTFSTHPQSPDALYLLSLAQIDFRDDESTARDTIRHDSIESTTFSTHPESPDALYFLSLAQIDFRYDESTARDTIRFDSIELCRIDNIFNPPSKPRCAIFTKSRANRLPVWRIDSKGHDSFRFDRVVSNRQHFEPTLKAQMRYIY